MIKTSNLFSVLILLWSLGTPAQVLYNPLDKLSPTPFGDFSAVGRVYSSQMPLDEPPCSGVLVAPKLVLTAFHCIAIRGIQAKNIKFVTDKEEVSLVQSVVYVAQGYPRSVKPQLSEKEMLSIQQEDLVLLRLKSPIISARPAALANLQDRVFEKQPMLGVGFPNFQDLDLKKPKKFQSNLKYDSTLEHLFLLDGIVYRGMSGGGVFIQENEGEKKLVGIIGANIKNEHALIMVPHSYNNILEEIKSQSDDRPALSQKTLCIDYRVEVAVATGQNVHCLSKTDTTFIINKDEIRDTGHGGKVWSRFVKSDVNALEAQKYCQQLGMKLPSGYPSQTDPVSETLSQEMKDSLFKDYGTNESDFTIAEKHGIREVIPDLNDELSWSSTSHPLFVGVIGVFSGQTQSIYYYYSGFKSNDTVVRCIK